MTTSTDIRGGVLSFYGRLTDELSREILRPGDYRLRMQPTGTMPSLEAAYKTDGYFTFQNIRQSAANYEFRFESGHYQERSFSQALPTSNPVELNFTGEDEVYLAIKTVVAGPKQITFNKIPFLPRIPQGSAVVGEGGFTTTLSQALEGVDVSHADLQSVAGLAAGQILRLARSRDLLARPGPYYPFPAGSTLVSLKLVSDVPGFPPLPGAKIRIGKWNGVASTTTMVGGLALHQVALPGLNLVLGPDRDVETFSDARGQAVIYLQPSWPITGLEITCSAAGHLPKTAALAITVGNRTMATVALAPA